MALGATRSLEYARLAAGIGGRELKAVGHDRLRAGRRRQREPAESGDRRPLVLVRPELVAGLTAEQVKGYQRDGRIVSTAKHFPGHGDTHDDSHTSLPTISHTVEEWNTIDAPPFQAAIKAGIDSIMTAHIVVPSSIRPATRPR